MRKLAALLIMAMLLALPLTGCDMDVVSTPDTTSNTTLSGQESPSIGDDAISEEDAKVRRVADQAVMEESGFSDLSVFEINVHKYYGGFTVKYRLKIQNYTSSEEYLVVLSEDCAVVRIDSANRGVYSRYLECATEELVKAAEERLNKRNDSDFRDYYLTVDNEGNLCLKGQIIVNVVLTGENSREEHIHVYASEIICPMP